MGGWSSSILYLVKAGCLIHVVRNYLVDVVLTFGPSMLPTLNINGNVLLAEPISTRLGKLRPGDVVIIGSPVKPGRMVTKRLIGMEGDQVTYVVDPMNSDRCQTIVVPKGHVWVEGDNIYASKDSRVYGAIPYGLIRGKAFWKVLPRKDFGAVASKPRE